MTWLSSLPQWLATLFVSLLLAGCSSRGVEPAADCAAALRVDSMTFVEHGYTRHPASRVGQAERALCEDVGPDARGIYFPERPQTVQIWSFDGQDAQEVVGVREKNDHYTIFIAEDLSEADRADALKALGDDTARNRQP